MNANFFELKGKIITDITIGDITTIKTNDRTYQIEHQQDCCESVWFDNMVGDKNNIIGFPITLAEEDSQSSKTSWGSKTTTSFFLETEKGRLELHWLGESNGYYNESVSFFKIIWLVDHLS